MLRTAIIVAVLFCASVPAYAASRPISDPCYRHEVDNGHEEYEFVGDRNCRQFKRPREFSGTLIYEFEGIQFLENENLETCLPAPREMVWLEIDSASHNPIAFEPTYGHAYRIRFVGREVRDMHRPEMHGYGHMSLFSGLIIVDRLISAQDLGRFDRNSYRDPFCLKK